MGDHEGARRVGLRMKEMLGAPRVSPQHQERTWTTVLRAALMGPRELGE